MRSSRRRSGTLGYTVDAMALLLAGVAAWPDGARLRARARASRTARSRSTSSTTRTTCRACSVRCSRRRSRAASVPTPGLVEKVMATKLLEVSLLRSSRSWTTARSSKPSRARRAAVLRWHAGRRGRAPVPGRGDSDLDAWLVAFPDRRSACGSHGAARARRAGSASRHARSLVDGCVVVDGRERRARSRCRPTTSQRALARSTARRWYSGDWLFDSDRLRGRCRARPRATRSRRCVRSATLRGVVPSLRAAFGYALGMADRARGSASPLSRPRARAARRRRSPMAVATACSSCSTSSSSERRREAGARRGSPRHSSGAARALVARLATVHGRARARDPRARVRRGARGRGRSDVACRRLERGTAARCHVHVDGDADHLDGRRARRCRSSTPASASPARTACSRSTRCHRSCARRSRTITSTSRGTERRMREVCFLIGRGDAILWADASDSPAALPGLARALGSDLAAPRRARGDRALAPDGPRARSPPRISRRCARSTARSAARMRYCVVAPRITIARLATAATPRSAPEPWWAGLLRLASGMQHD